MKRTNSKESICFVLALGEAPYATATCPGEAMRRRKPKRSRVASVVLNGLEKDFQR